MEIYLDLLPNILILTNKEICFHHAVFQILTEKSAEKQLSAKYFNNRSLE